MILAPDKKLEVLRTIGDIIATPRKWNVHELNTLCIVLMDCNANKWTNGAELFLSRMSRGPTLPPVPVPPPTLPGMAPVIHQQVDIDDVLAGIRGSAEQAKAEAKTEPKPPPLIPRRPTQQSK